MRTGNHILRGPKRRIEADSSALPRPRAEGRRNVRGGYVLIIVLGLSVVAFSVGTAYLEAHSSVVPEAVNMMAASRATYLAGSGVDIACHYLAYPPDSVADGDYWTGDVKLRIDATPDYIYVRVLRDETHANVYQIDSFGVAHDTDGELRGKRGVRAHVMVPPAPMIRIPYAIHADGEIDAGSRVTIEGDMHANERIVFRGWCISNVSSRSFISWLTSPFPSSMKQFAPRVTTPPRSLSTYNRYTFNGDECNAYSYGSDNLTAASAATLNSTLDADADNPGRIVVVRTGTFEIYPGADFRGTLVVDGDLKFKGAGTFRVSAATGFPAVVCTKDVRTEDNAADVTITGAVLCDLVNLNGKTDVLFKIVGALVTQRSGAIENETGSRSTTTLQWDKTYSEYYDLTKTDTPFTLIDWADY